FYIARTAWHAPAEERMRFRRAAALARVPAGAAVLDVGARDRGLRRVLPEDVRYQGIEIDPAFARPDVLIHDISQGIPFPPGSYDFAFCLEVLEHVPNPFGTLSEMHRILKPGGVLIVSVPNPYHFKEIIWHLFQMISLKSYGLGTETISTPYHFKEIIWNLFRISDRQGH